jgi:hypothetical protein
VKTEVVAVAVAVAEQLFRCAAEKYAIARGSALECAAFVDATAALRFVPAHLLGGLNA